MLASLICLPLLASACGGASPTGSDPDPRDPSTIQVQIAVQPALSPLAGALELEASGSAQLAALDGAGHPLAAEWASSDPAVATVSATGTVTAVAPGSATILARASGAQASAPVLVRAPAQAEAPPPSCSSFPHARRVAVSTAGQLEAALAGARPGDLIELADGTYRGYFNVHASGTAAQRIILCGSGRATLHTGSMDSGHALWLDGASYWTLSGLILTNSLGGVQVSRGNGNVIQWTEIHSVGQHGIHLSSYSSDNVIRHVSVHHTGRRLPEYGEAVYVGSWNGHWCERTRCEPDRSDRNQVLDSRFGPYVTAEHVQVMEGTTGGVIRGNLFDGTGMGAPDAPWADAWVYVLGNGYVIEDNRGAHSLRHGFDTGVEVDGWGRDNVFRRNVADVGAADGYGFSIDPDATGTRVACDNVVRNAGKGFANVACR